MVRTIQTIRRSVLPATAVAMLVLSSGSAAGSAVQPTPDALPATMVAVVSEVPVRRGRITKAEFQHQLLLDAVSAGRRSVSKPGSARYEKGKVAAVRSLLEGAWIVGQAAEWGITVTHAQVSREVARIRKESFKDGAEYRRFLKETRYTRRDVNERVEVQMFSERLQWHLSRRARKETSSKADERRVFKEFVDEFIERWRDRTVCAPDYVNDRCSNGPAA